jgi:arginyl-tRNA synthetase
MSPAKTLFALVRERVHAALAAPGLLPPGLDLTKIAVEAPRDPAHGDFTTNAAMVVAGRTGRGPHELATMIAGRIAIDALVARVDIAGPGFINLTLTSAAFAGELRALLAAGAAHRRADVGRGAAVTVAHLRAAPTAPMQVGDGRAAVFADALAGLLDCAGHVVTRKDCVDDAGCGQTIVVLSSGRGVDAKGMQLAAKAERETKVVQPARLLRAGRPVPGEPVASRGVLDDASRDALRFMMLLRRHDAMLDVDLVHAMEQTRDNPVFCVQYGHARGHSVFRHARAIFPVLPEDAQERALVLAGAPLERLDGRAESSLMRRVALYSGTIEAAAAAREPHRIALYLHELASEFHAVASEGKDSPHLRFIIQDDPQLTLARLALVQGILTVLASGLSMLGVGAPEEIR